MFRIFAVCKLTQKLTLVDAVKLNGNLPNKAASAKEETGLEMRVVRSKANVEGGFLWTLSGTNFRYTWLATTFKNLEYCLSFIVCSRKFPKFYELSYLVSPRTPSCRYIKFEVMFFFFVRND